jgi:regulator of protease activity HflC (stomatin/prohibitin superfamily)
MSFSPKPPTNPLDALMQEAAKQIGKKLKEAAAKNGIAIGTSPPPSPPLPSHPSSAGMPHPATSHPHTRGTGFSPPPPGAPPPPSFGNNDPPKKSVLGTTDAERWFKRLIGIGGGLFLLSQLSNLAHFTNFGRWAGNNGNAQKGGFEPPSNDWEHIMNSLFGNLFWLVLFVVAIILVVKSIRVVPQQRALVVERLGRYHATLEPGLRFTIPFVDRISARHDLREVALDVPSQVCITRDNTQLQVDGILYFQVTDPKLATYGSSNYVNAITQLAQTTLRSVVGKLELDKTFEERDMINHAVVNALDEAASNWGVKVLRYEIKDLTPPKEILHAMQAQITAEREKRALIAASEGRKQEQINIAMGQKEASIAKSEGDKISDINNAQGEAAAILAKADANAEAIRKIAMAIESQGGLQAVNLKVAEQYVAALANIARTGNTIVVPANLTDIASLVTTATSVLKATK